MSTIEELKQDQANKQLELTEKDQTIRTLSSQLKEIYSSTAWKMVQQLWRIQVRMRSYRAFARLEGWIRTRITQGQQNKQQSIQQAPSLRDDPHASVQPVPSQMPKDKSDRFIIQYLSNDHNDRVILLTPTFFDWDGNNMFRGGAERYLIELSHLIKSLGYDPVIVQCGNFDWMRYYYDMQVIGVKITAGFETLPLEVERLNISAALIIYSPFHLASKKISIPSIGISHGVYWDNRSFQNFPTNLNKTIDDIISKLAIVSSIVSVDTNTINWLRATRSDLSSNAAYVPNFVDLN